MKVTAFLLIIAGVLYISQPETIFKINAFLRETLINDAYVSLHRRTWGLIFFLAGILLFSLQLF